MVKKRRWYKKGIILISLISLIFIGVIIVIPNLTRFHTSCGPHREGISNLGAIRTLEEAYRAEFDRYGSLDEIGFEPKGIPRYEYYISHYEKDSFEALAVPKWGMTVTDVYRINEQGKTFMITGGKAK